MITPQLTKLVTWTTDLSKLVTHWQMTIVLIANKKIEELSVINFFIRTKTGAKSSRDHLLIRFVKWTICQN